MIRIAGSEILCVEGTVMKHETGMKAFDRKKMHNAFMVKYDTRGKTLREIRKLTHQF